MCSRGPNNDVNIACPLNPTNMRTTLFPSPSVGSREEDVLIFNDSHPATGNWMSTPAMIINAPASTTHSTHSLLCQTRGRIKYQDQKKLSLHLCFIHWSAHFLPPTCGSASRCEWVAIIPGTPSLKCRNPEPGAAAVVDVFASESSQGNGPTISK